MPRLLAFLIALSFLPPLIAGEKEEFFETRVRPVLVENCYGCHSAKAEELKGGLRLDGRSLMLKGGDSGPAIVGGEPAKSHLIEAVKYGNKDLQMPPKGKLADAAIADLEKWIRDGAVWPGDESKAANAETFDLQKRKAEHWAWRPVKPQTPPAVRNERWIRDPVDRFLLAKLEEKRLAPAAEAEPTAWLRRVTFALTGLPPTPEELDVFSTEKDCGKVVDRLLASPAFGERWARHWLDLVRYAESRGHEYDFDSPNAWQYRDYVIRAFNADVSYRQFALEHLAGDVLPKPRILRDANESILGTGFWLLGEEVQSPVDIRQDQADRYDNRIDVFGKTFLGLTVACARCHDHKFDAIATKDYYAHFGLLQGSSYRQVRFDGWEKNRRVAAELQTLRAATRKKVITLLEREPPFSVAWEKWRATAKPVIDYANLKDGEWLPDDVTFGPGPRLAGSVRIEKGKPIIEDRAAAAFDRFWADLRAAPHTVPDPGSLGQKQRAGFTIRTPSFVQEKKGIFALVRGAGFAYAAVAGHTTVNGPLHGGLVQKITDGPGWRWMMIPMTDYQGQRLHLEFTADPTTEFAVALVLQADHSPPAIPPPQFVVADVPADEAKAIVESVAATEKALREKVVWESRLAPALLDGSPVDDAVFIRGNPRLPGQIVAHRGLEALDGPEGLKHKSGSGRLEWAHRVTDPQANPFFARVIVNRVWHHLFGRGLVASCDNFGVLGEKPSHPELLDYLATEFAANDLRFKPFIKRLVLSSAYRMASAIANDPLDPANDLLHHFRVRRLEGEAIRDAMLLVSGKIKVEVGGPPVPIHLTGFLDGRGKPPASGPVDGQGRRSIYLSVRRNFLPPFLLAFDTPIPFSAVGVRQSSNVPAQSLILMNDPFVHEMAKAWGSRSANNTVRVGVERMYRQALARRPTEKEMEACLEFLGGKPEVAAWAGLAHALYNLKEFRFVP